MSDVIPLLDRPDLTWKEKIAYIAFQLKEMDSKVEAPLQHLFEPGMYIREMALPADAVVVGRPHVHGHRVELVSGKVLHITERGKLIVDAPFELHSNPGDQIVAYAITDIVARTYHPNPNEDRDIEKLENEWFHPADPVLELGATLHARLTRES